MDQQSTHFQLKGQIQQFIQWYNEYIFIHQDVTTRIMNNVLQTRYPVLYMCLKDYDKWEYALSIDSNFETVVDIKHSSKKDRVLYALRSIISKTDSKIWMAKLWKQLVDLDEKDAYNELKNIYRTYNLMNDGFLTFMEVLLEDEHYIQVVQEDLKAILTDYNHDKKYFDILNSIYNSTSYLHQFIEDSFTWNKMIEAGVNASNLSQLIELVFQTVTSKNWFRSDSDFELESQRILVFNEAKKQVFIDDSEGKLILKELDEKSNEVVEISVVPGIIDQMNKTKLPKEMIIEVIMNVYMPIYKSLQDRFASKLWSTFDYNNQSIRKSGRKRNSIEAELPDMALFIPVVTDFMLD